MLNDGQTRSQAQAQVPFNDGIFAREKYAEYEGELNAIVAKAESGLTSTHELMIKHYSDQVSLLAACIASSEAMKAKIAEIQKKTQVLAKYADEVRKNADAMRKETEMLLKEVEWMKNYDKIVPPPIILQD